MANITPERLAFLRKQSTPEGFTIYEGKDSAGNTTVQTRKLVVKLNITDSKTTEYSLPDPSLAISYSDVADWVDLVVQKGAVVVDGIAATGLNSAWVETTTYEYLEPDSSADVTTAGSVATTEPF